MPGKGERCREIKRQGWGVRDRYREVMEIERGRNKDGYIERETQRDKLRPRKWIMCSSESQ